MRQARPEIERHASRIIECTNEIVGIGCERLAGDSVDEHAVDIGDYCPKGIEHPGDLDEVAVKRRKL
jgi:hypothetical protein